MAQVISNIMVGDLRDVASRLSKKIDAILETEEFILTDEMKAELRGQKYGIFLLLSKGEAVATRYQHPTTPAPEAGADDK